MSARLQLLPRALRWPLGAAGSAVLGLALGLALCVTLPMAFGARTYTVLSGSMRPALGVGDVVIDAPIAPLRARVGDIVTFRDPGDGARLITHRVRSVSADGGTVRVVTKGDANNTVERWTVPATGRIGRVAYHVPKLGYALFFTRSRLGRLALLIVPAALLAMWELVRLWRPEEERTGVDAVA